MPRRAIMLVVCVFSILSLCGVSIAADVIVYESKLGDVVFDHKAHSEKLSDCAKCHYDGISKIVVDKDYAHSLCVDCHDNMGGPSNCLECHNKSLNDKCSRCH